MNRQREQTSSASGLVPLTGPYGLSEVLDRLPLAAYLCDLDGQIAFYNEPAVALWGRSPRLNDPSDRFCGSHRLLTPEGEPIRRAESWMARALDTGKDYLGKELLIERPNGSRVLALVHAVAVHDETGALVAGVNVMADLTEQEQLARDLERTLRRLHDAEWRQTEFLATLAHELRNPLASIRNAVALLRLKHTEQVTEKAVRIVERQVNHLARLVDDLVDMGRMVTNTLELRRERCELGEVLRMALDASFPAIQARRHALLFNLPPQPVHLLADPVRLAQAFSNLLDNAAKYMDQDGQIEVFASGEGDEVLVSVRDRGIGIAPEMLPGIFDLFTRADQSASRSEGGLGIGLSLVKRLVEMHGGGVTAKSEGAGTGSTFTVRLPVLH